MRWFQHRPLSVPPPTCQLDADADTLALYATLVASTREDRLEWERTDAFRRVVRVGSVVVSIEPCWGHVALAVSEGRLARRFHVADPDGLLGLVDAALERGRARLARRAVDEMTERF